MILIIPSSANNNSQPSWAFQPLSSLHILNEPGPRARGKVQGMKLKSINRIDLKKCQDGRIFYDPDKVEFVSLRFHTG